MTKIIDEPFVTRVIKESLSPKWGIVSEKDLHEKGCDLVLKDLKNKNQACRFLIECKGKSYATSARSVNETVWLYALGQIITRMSVVARHAYKYGLGLPEVSAQKALRRIPWQAARHLCLHIFSVDDKGKVTKYLPSDFKKIQLKRKNEKRV